MNSRLFVWVDHTARYDGNSGVQRVVRSLAHALLKAGRDVAFVEWSAGDYSLARARPAGLAVLARYGGPLAPAQEQPAGPLHLNGLDEGMLEGAWLLVPEVPTISGHGRRITADIVEYCRSKGMKVAFIFYDLVPLLVDGYEDMRLAHADYVQQMALADLILPISAHSGETLRRYYVETLHLPASELPEIADTPLAEAFSDAARPVTPPPPASGPIRILSLGTIEPRKNQTGLLRAFNRLCRRRPELDLELHVVGHLHPKVASEFEALAAANTRVRYRRYMPDSEVIDLYRTSAFTVFTSIEEGFGLPIAESLWFGRPVICADFGAMAEIARGGGCLTVDTHLDEAIQEALESLAADPALRDRLAGEAAARAFRSWDDYTHDIRAALEAHMPLRRVWLYADGAVRTAYNSGIQRVARALGRGLQEEGVDLVCVRWDAETESLQPLNPVQASHFARWSGPTPRSGDAADPRPGDWLIVPEITMGPGPSAETLMAAARRMGLRIAYVFYDLIPLKLSPKWPTPRTTPIYEAAVAEAYEAFWRQIASADAILPISDFAAADLRAWFRRSLSRQVGLDRRIAAIELAGEFAAAPRATAVETAARPGAVFTILSIGTLEPRKNQLLLVRAFLAAAARPGSPPMRLIIAGSQQPYPDYAAEVAAAAMAGKVELVADADDDRLAALYREADLVAYASYEEGFGLPVLESAWFGRPCLCHNDGAMLGTAAGGGAETVNMLDEAAVADILHHLATNRERLVRLQQQAIARPARTWRSYARDVAVRLAELGPAGKKAVRALDGLSPTPLHSLDRPLLSICVTTYNRAAWLGHSLPRILELVRPYRDVVEVLVCDNAATDDTPAVLTAIAQTESFASYRNPENVGMLGNMGATVRRATGEYIWLIGDDDILVEGVIENILEGIVEHPDAEMVYLNYAATRFNEPDELNDLDKLIASASAIAEGGPNRYVARLREVADLNENFFTAIYACIFRRNHALRAYTQNVSGPPFSTLLRCVPSTVYAMRMMLDLPAYWVGTPGLVVNMNVSWREWLPLWHLERMPELYEWAEREGMSGTRLDDYRRPHLAGAATHLRHLYFKGSDADRANFDVVRFIARSAHLEAFRNGQLAEIRQVYRDAAANGRLKPGDPTPEELFASFGLPPG